MKNTLKYLHLTGLSLFFGSIITYVVISILLENASLESLAFGRLVISTGTAWLTVPGMWLLAISGITLGWLRYGIGSRFFQIKLGLMLLVVLNAHLFVAPAVYRATELAQQSLLVGHLLPDYALAYRDETVFGAINVLLILSAAAVAVWTRRGVTARLPISTTGG